MQNISRRRLDPRKVWGFHYGFQELDEATGGIQWEHTRDYILVGGRSGVGKSAFGMSACLTVAEELQNGFPGLEVRVILLEMTPDDCYQRAISQIADIPINILRSGIGMDAFMEEQARKAAAFLADLPIVFLEGSPDADTIGRFVAGDNPHTGRACGFWMLDHIGIVPTGPASRTNPAFSLGEVSKSFQQLCRSVAPGMILSQLNRESLKRKDPKPNVSDFYNGDRALQDCDKAILLDRPESRMPKAPGDVLEEEIGLIILGKNRQGPMGEYQALYTPAKALWSDLDQQELELGL